MLYTEYLKYFENSVHGETKPEFIAMDPPVLWAVYYLSSNQGTNVKCTDQMKFRGYIYERVQANRE